MVFHWTLSDSKSPQVSRTRLRILAFVSNAVILIVSTRPPTSIIIIIITIIIVIIPCEFFSPELASALQWSNSQSFQITWTLLGARSLQIYDLFRLDSSSEFQFLQSLFKALENCTKLQFVLSSKHCFSVVLKLLVHLFAFFSFYFLVS